MKHLWEVNHPYYCNDGNYYNNDCVFEYETFEQYMDEFGDADKDYNLIFRWDWNISDPEDYEAEIEDDPDFEMPQALLHLYHMHQRKGRFVVHLVKVTEADEPLVREYLMGYAEHMKALWEPLL